MLVSGLEFSDNQISILTLKKERKSLRIVSQATRKLQKGIIFEGKVYNKEALVKELIELKKSAKPKTIKSPYIIGVLPENVVYLTTKKFPNIDKDKIKEAAEINLPEILPGKREEIYWGWQENPNSVNEKEVIVASAQKIEIEKYLEIISSAGFSAIALEPFSVASARSFANVSNSLLLHLEDGFCQAAVCEKGIACFSAFFEFSNSEEFIFNAKRVLNFYLAGKKSDTVEILVSGTKAQENLAFLGEKLKLDIKLASGELVLQGISSPALLGGALRGLIEQKADTNLSLLPVGTQEAFEKKKALGFLRGITNVVAVTSILFFLIYGGFYFLLTYINTSASQQVANLTKSSVSNDDAAMKKELEEVSPKISVMSELISKEKPLNPYLEALTGAKIDGISFESISVKEDRSISLNGKADSREALSLFRQKIEENKIFKKVNLPSTSVEAESISFVMELAS